LQVDKPESDDVVEVASQAFLYLSINQGGNWNEVVDVLTAIISFLKKETDIMPRIERLQALKEILQQRPVLETEVRNWFDQVYR
jgi:hypothetical protein